MSSGRRTVRRVVSALALAVLAAGAAAPAEGRLVFRVGYERFTTGQVPAPWQEVEWGGSCDQRPSLASRVRPVRDPVRGGERALQIVVAPGDEFCDSTGERTLLKEHWASRRDRPGPNTLSYYGFSYYLPLGWRHPAEGPWRWEYIFEEHADSRFVQAPIKVGFQGDALQLRLNTGDCTRSPLCEERIRTSRLAYAEGRWVDVILRVRYRLGHRGRAAVWTRVAGRDRRFVRRLRIGRVPTLPWKRGQAPAKLYVLHGYYRSPSSHTSRLYLDNYAFAHSRRPVVRAFQRG